MAKLITVQKPAGLEAINETICQMERHLEKSEKQLELFKRLRTLPEYVDPLDADRLDWLDSQFAEADKAAKETHAVISDAKSRREQAVREWLDEEKQRALRMADDIEREASTLTGPASFMRRKVGTAQACWLRHKNGGLRELQQQIEQLTGIAL